MEKLKQTENERSSSKSVANSGYNSSSKLESLQPPPLQFKVEKSNINTEQENEVSQLTGKEFSSDALETPLENVNKSNRSMQFQTRPNNTGLPNNLKTGIESISGYSLDDVKVHYNSEKPAQLQAQAYARGNEIHVASGQEKHLPHEAWHVVQQKQGRVQPTTQLKGKFQLNDNEELENEAEVMGKKAYYESQNTKFTKKHHKSIDSRENQSVQRKEDDSEYSAEKELLNDVASGTQAAQGQMEFIINSFKWAEKFKQPIPKEVKDAANEILRITESFNKRITQLKDIVDEVDNFKLWINAQSDFAFKTINLDLKNRGSVESWMESMKQSNEASKSYQDTIVSWLAKNGKSSIAYAKLSFVSSVVFAYKDVGIAGLDAGLKNVNKYIDRKDPENYLKNNSRIKTPPPPSIPMRWMSSKEIKRNKEIREEKRRKKEQDDIRIRKRKEEKEYFNKHILPKVYRKSRHKIHKKLIKDFMSTHDGEKLQAIRRLLQGFITSGEIYKQHKGSVNKFGKLKSRVSEAEMLKEITHLKYYRVEYYQSFYEKALDHYIKEKEDKQEQETKETVTSIINKIQSIF